VITVTSSPELAVSRVVARDGVSAEDVIDRMRNQWSSERKQKSADFVIYNNESELVIPQILEIHNRLIS
jgi:dephospho-CoA kinase